MMSVNSSRNVAHSVWGKDLAPVNFLDVPVQPVTDQPASLGGAFWRSVPGEENQKGQSSGLLSSLQSYWDIARRYSRLILVISALILGLTVLRLLLSTPQYTAEAKLRIGSYNPIVSSSVQEGYLAQQSREREYLNTQVEILRSLTVADAVLSDANLGPQLRRELIRKDVWSRLQQGLYGKERLRRDEWDGAILPATELSVYRSSVSDLEQYLTHVSVLPIRLTSLVRVIVTAPRAELAAQLANKHVEEYLQLLRSGRYRTALENLGFLKRQAAEVEAQVALAEQKLANYAQENRIAAPIEEEQAAVTRLGELNKLLSRISGERIAAESAWREAKLGHVIPSGKVGDHSLQHAAAQLAQLEAEYARLAAKFKSQYPAMAERRAQIEAMRAGMAERKAQIVQELEAKYRADLKAEQELLAEIESEQKKSFELSKRQVQYNILRREYESIKSIHQSLLTQLKELQVSAEVQDHGVNLAEPAPIPAMRASPRVGLSLLFALIVGPSLGFFAAVVCHALDNTLRSPEELIHYLAYPFLGVVPKFPVLSMSEKVGGALTLDSAQMGERVEEALGVGSSFAAAEEAAPAPPTGRELISRLLPQAPCSESFRAIRTSLLLSAAGGPRKILVTSAVMGEGKTAFTANLAVSLADAGYRVVVVDADLRRPSLHQYFPVAVGNLGLSCYLSGQAEASTVVEQVPGVSLFFTPAGVIPPNPAELLGSEQMRALCDDLARRFDYLLIDSPPVLPVTDAVLISRMVDGCVLLARAEVTPRQMVKEASRRLDMAGAKVLGMVLNGVEQGVGYYYGGYGR